MEGPDGLYVREGGDDHQHGGLDDRDDHRELDLYIEQLNISVVVGDEEIDTEQECAVHAELDKIWKIEARRRRTVQRRY